MMGRGRERGNEQSTYLPDSEVRRYAWMREWLGGQGILVVDHVGRSHLLGGIVEDVQRMRRASRSGVRIHMDDGGVDDYCKPR